MPGAATRTSWFERDLPAMWRTLENQQTDGHWRLVAGWRKASELTALHLRRLEQYRANLADVWPPARNAAAAAYVARLDFLIQNVRTTHDVAAANYSTLAATVGALAAARHDLRPLYEEYVTKSKALKDHTEQSAFNAAAEGPTLIGAPPTTQTDLERLNNRARAIMYTLSHTLVEAEAAIRQPPTYQPQTGRYISDPDVYGMGSARDTEPAPQLGRDGHANAGATSENNRRLTSAPPHLLEAASLGYSMPSPRPTPPATGTAISRTMPSHIQGAAREDTASSSTSRLISPDGVIGPRPVNPRQEPAVARETRRINPVGGLITGTHEKDLGTNHPGAPQQFYGTTVPQATERQRRTITSRYTETRWETAEGVPPVITPRHRLANADPGPAIGLDQ
ncbi:hypothetical protein [Phytohabitans suffuscus]